VSTPLVEGNCTFWKNGTYQDGFRCRFVFDRDLNLLKVISGGNVVVSFRANQVTGMAQEVKGLISKKLLSHVGVKFPSGDEFVLVFESSDATSFTRISGVINQAKTREQAGAEIITSLRARDRVPIEDVCAILTKYGLPNSFEDGRNYVEYAISSNQAQGVFDGKAFVSKMAMEAQSVRYDVVAKFEMNDSGAILFKCPNCGASLPLESKDSTGTCKYCGGTYAIPRKLLDAI
jgi:predicted RNA-binding Zn-ribbon protein involved in translation (DUF1610 family)